MGFLCKKSDKVIMTWWLWWLTPLMFDAHQCQPQVTTPLQPQQQYLCWNYPFNTHITATHLTIGACKKILQGFPSSSTLPPFLSSTITMSTPSQPPQGPPTDPNATVTVLFDSNIIQNQQIHFSPSTTTNCLSEPTTAAVALLDNDDKQPLSQSHLLTTIPNAPPSDLMLLEAVKSLDDLLTQYPRPIDSLDNDTGTQLHHQTLMDFQALFDQQTRVLSTINVLLGELCEKIDTLIADACPCPTQSPPLNASCASLPTLPIFCLYPYLSCTSNHILKHSSHHLSSHPGHLALMHSIHH